MAKRTRNNLVAASFHYLVKTAPNDNDPQNPIESGFTEEEYQRNIQRISDTRPLDETNPDIITAIKRGQELPFGEHEVVDGFLHFGSFDGAYYGQRYRNNVLGVVSADSLNLRTFYYLIKRLRDGRVLVGVTYHGQFGDYEGIKACLTHLMGGNYTIASRTIRSIAGEIGDGVPIELKLTYRKMNDRPERRNLFGRSGVIAIKNTEFGEDFAEQVDQISRQVRGIFGKGKEYFLKLLITVNCSS